MLKPIAEPVAFPRELREAEWPHADRPPQLGVGLSGGGIRSATLSLGFFQGLAHLGLLPRLDYLSTVSGGGYFGAFYGHLLQRKATLERATDAVAAAQAELADPGSRPVAFLRNNGRYLSPNGAGDLLLGAAIALRNWVAVMIVMGSLALLVLVTLILARHALLDGLVPWRLPTLSTGPFLVEPSSLFVVALVMLVVLAVPPGWAYWLVPGRSQGHTVRQLLGQWAAPVASIGALIAAYQVPGLPRFPLAGFGVVGALAAAWYAGSRWWAGRKRQAAPDAETLTAGNASVARGTLSRWLTRMMVAVGCVLGVAVVDTLGGTLASLAEGRQGGAVVSGYAALGVVIAWLRRRLAMLTNRYDANARLPIPTAVLINGGAVVLVLALLGGMAAIPHLVLDRGGTTALIWLAGGAAALVVAIGGVWPFVNRSSLHAVYEARLRRAYLGATNPARAGEGEGFPPVTEPHPGDGLARDAYHPERHGGPVHLINVTINETVDGRSQVQQRDRKGVGMAIGPAGVSVSKHHHALWSAEEKGPGFMTRVKRALHLGGSGEPAAPPATSFRVFPAAVQPEDLDIGQWVAISGAAFSTGLGSRTSLGFSLLAGLFNVRLGYWWWSGVQPGDRAGRARRSWVSRALVPVRATCAVQAALLDEWFARFPGVARPEWYLSDGGHFENLGGYELIRRRLPLIVLCDHEQDADYGFQGLGNLVRKARTDFGTAITFLSQQELARRFGGAGSGDDWRHWIGPLEALRRGARQRDDVHDPVTGERRLRIAVDRTEYSLAHAAVATVDYPAIPAQGLAASRGWLLYIKPTLVGGEPADIAHYHREHPDFPHQSTGDQFFDEAQWESYRALGALMAARLFGGVATGAAGILDVLGDPPERGPVITEGPDVRTTLLMGEAAR